MIGGATRGVGVMMTGWDGAVAAGWVAPPASRPSIKLIIDAHSPLSTPSLRVRTEGARAAPPAITPPAAPGLSLIARWWSKAIAECADTAAPSCQKGR